MSFINLLLSLSLSLNLGLKPAEEPPAKPVSEENNLSEQDRWVDSVYRRLTPEQRLGQLFMIRAHSDKGAAHEAEVERLIRECQPGGVIFFQGDPRRQAELTNRYQAAAELPLMVAMDAEWGLGMRLKETMSFPYGLTLGAVQEDRLLFEMGREIGRQCRRLGVHVNFAPVTDINNNPDNPVIGFRSFGEDRYNVTAKSYWYLRGMKSAGVMGCAKHFPGHGDTQTDSHQELPTIPHSRKRLDSLELFPFKFLMEKDLESIMIAHLQVPALDTSSQTPTTLSRKVVTGLLREELGFDGLIFTDGMEMGGVANHYPAGEAEARALLAGNDIILLPRDLKVAMAAIERYLAEGKLSSAQVEASVKRVLAAKYQLGLTKPQRVSLDGLLADLHRPAAEALRLELLENALTLLRDRQGLVPIDPADYTDIATLSIGTPTKTEFQMMLDQYGNFAHYQLPFNASLRERQVIARDLREKDLVLISLHGLSQFPRNNYGLSSTLIDFIHLLGLEEKAVLTIFGNPYLLKSFDRLDQVVMAYENDTDMQRLAAQALVGAIGFRGRLPVTASEEAAFYQGIQTMGGHRFGYCPPERVEMDPRLCNRVDTLMEEAIRDKATPGAVVLAARQGRIFFERAYGHHTYHDRESVETGDLYDLASVTKVAATTLSIMKLYEQGKLDLHAPLRRYLPELDTFNKADLTVYDIMTHRARLQPWIPFYLKTLDRSRRRRGRRPSRQYYSMKPKEGFELQVTENLYLRTDYPDSMRYEIWASELREKEETKYSDLGFYLLADLVERLSGMPLDVFVEENFYRPMGLKTTGFNPWRHFPPERIAPSEDDHYYRHQEVRGYVHDMGAAMMGGVSGHAGLFSNARDLAAIFEMLLNDGVWGGRRYLQPETIRLFTTRRADDTRRGIGFDMRETDPAETMNMSPKASRAAFGHLGFTGVAVWADPVYDLVFVVLTNRTYPSKSGYKWGRDNYRPRLQEVFYQAALMPET